MYDIVSCSPEGMSRIERTEATFPSKTIAQLGLQEWFSSAIVGSKVNPSESNVAEIKVIELIRNCY